MLLGVGLIGYVYYTFSGKDQNLNAPFAAVPKNAAFMMHISDINQMQTFLDWFDEMAEHHVTVVGVPMNPMEHWGPWVHQLDSLNEMGEPWSSWLSQGVVFSTGVTGRGDAWCMSTAAPKDADPLAFFAPWFGTADQQRDFEGIHLAHWKKPNVYSAIVHHKFVISSTASLMEQLILDQKENADDPVFEKVQALASKDIALHFYAHLEEKGWMELDPLFADGVRKLSGYMVLADTVHHPLQLISTGGNKEVAKHLPTNTAMLYDQSASDFSSAWQNAENYFAGTAPSEYWSRAWSMYGDSCACDLNDAVIAWRGNEWGCAVV